MPLGFGNLVGLFALASLIPFIILYFIRPKPKEIVIPSVMFLGRTREFVSKSGFLRRLANDKLLLLQILVLGLISLFFSAPYLATENARTGEVVLVLDTSASIGSDNNFDRLKDEAFSNLGGKNTAITIGNNPYLIFEGLSKKEAERELKKIKPTATRSAVADSLTAAKKILDKSSGERSIVVVSDFTDTEDGNVKEKIDTIRAADIPLKVANIASKDKANVGIVGLTLRKTQSEALIKNFCCSAREVVVDYDGEKTKLIIPRNQTESYTFPTAEGKSILKIDIDDALEADNSVSIINEKDQKASILLVSQEENKFLEAAIKATDELSFGYTTPDKLKTGYDVYILQKIGQDSLKLKEFMEDELKNGKSIVIIPEGITGDYRGLLDFSIGSNIPGGESESVSQATFTDGIEFGRQSSVKQVDCTGVCEGVYVSTGDEPLIMIQPKYNGLVAYYGLLDEAGFQNRPDYPIFWTRFTKHLGHVRDLSSMNLRTGSVVSFSDEVSYLTPSGLRGKNKEILIEETGFYEIEGKTYSANLLSIEESELKDVEGVTSNIGGISELEQNYIVNKNFWKWLILAAVFLLLIEWVLINRKIRRQKYRV